MKRNKILLWIAIVLLSANLLTLASIFVKDRSVKQAEVSDQAKSNRSNNFENRVASELQLSDEQIEQYRLLKRAHMRQIRQLHDSINCTKMLIHNQLMTKNPDIEYINHLADSIGKLNAEFEKLNYKHFYEMKQALNEDQQEKFKQLFEKLPFGPQKGKHRNRGHFQRN